MITFVTDSDKKASIASDILHQHPEWFVLCKNSEMRGALQCH